MGRIRDGRWCCCGQPHWPAVRGGLDSDRSYREVSGAPNRAEQTLALFVTVLFISILLAIPDQSHRVLGVELVALAIITGVGQLVLDRRAKVDPDTRDASAHAIASLLDAIAPNAITSVLLLTAGLLLVFAVDAGLDVLVLPVLAGLAGGVTSAWLLLTKIPE
jgi:uncharacterized membrane protein